MICDQQLVTHLAGNLTYRQIATRRERDEFARTVLLARLRRGQTPTLSPTRREHLVRAAGDQVEQQCEATYAPVRARLDQIARDVAADEQYRRLTASQQRQWLRYHLTALSGFAPPADVLRELAARCPGPGASR